MQKQILKICPLFANLISQYISDMTTYTNQATNEYTCAKDRATHFLQARTHMIRNETQFSFRQLLRRARGKSAKVQLSLDEGVLSSLNGFSSPGRENPPSASHQDRSARDRAGSLRGSGDKAQHARRNVVLSDHDDDDDDDDDDDEGIDGTSMLAESTMSAREGSIRYAVRMRWRLCRSFSDVGTCNM